MMGEEDRISNLPDDIIHHIFSFLDLKYAMQTSALSKKWKLVWTVLPQLNLDSYKFCDTSRFNKFVKHVLLHRNRHREVSVLVLRCRGAATVQLTVKSIVNYACLHNVRRLILVWSGTKHQQFEFPQFIFSCRGLKDLTLAVQNRTSLLLRGYMSESGWDFPSLEILNLRNFNLDGGENKRINLFAKCVNLKDLTLRDINMNGLEELTLCLPQLCNLTITSFGYCEVVNVVAPQLQNLTASFGSIQGLNCRDLSQKSVEGFSSLEKVNISWPNFILGKETHSKLLRVLQKLYSAKFLILDAYIIKVLSSCVDQLFLEPCPFNYLKCLKMNALLETKIGRRATTREHVVVPVQLKNYLLDKSPSATFIIDYPQNVHDDARWEGETKIPDTVKENKILEAKIQMQDQVTTKQKEVVDAEIEMQDKAPHKRSSQQVHDDVAAKKMAKLDAEKQPPADTIITQEKEMLDANTQTQDEVISKQEQDQVITKQEVMFEAKMQMQGQVITKQKAKFEVPHKRSTQQVHDELTPKKMAKLDAEKQHSDTVAKEKGILEISTQMRDEVCIIAEANEVLDANIHMQDEGISKQEVMFEAKIKMQDEAIRKQKAMFEAKIEMLDHLLTTQKAILEAKIQMQDNVIAEHKAKIQMQDNVIEEQKARIQLLEEAHLDNE